MVKLITWNIARRDEPWRFLLDTLAPFPRGARMPRERLPSGSDHPAQTDPRPKWPFWIGTGGRFHRNAQRAKKSRK